MANLTPTSLPSSSSSSSATPSHPPALPSPLSLPPRIESRVEPPNPSPELASPTSPTTSVRRPGKQKREIIAVACTACQKRKSKCDGKRPSCTRCRRYSIQECVYDDSRRVTSLRSVNATQSEKIRDYEYFINLLREGSEDGAKRMLRELRSSSKELVGFLPDSVLRGALLGGTQSVQVSGEWIDESMESLERSALPFRGHLPVIMTSRPHITSDDPYIVRRNWHPALQIRVSDPVAHDMMRSIEAWPTPTSPSITSSPNGSTPKEYANYSSTLNEQRSYGQTSRRQSGAEFDSSSYDQANTFTPSQQQRLQDPIPHFDYVEVYGVPTAIEVVLRSNTPQPISQVTPQVIPLYLIQPRVQIENSPLSRVYTDFRDAARLLIQDGKPVSEILGPPYVEVSLYFRDRTASDPYSANTWACEIMKSFGCFDQWFHLGSIVLLTKFMRWLIYPTAETYAQVPDMIKPLPRQRLVKHVPAIDLIIIPAFRDAVMDRLRDWITPMSLSTRCNWPYSVEEAVKRDPSTGLMKITDRFEEVVINPENWSWDRSVLVTFPEVEGKVRIREYKTTF
ncbi:hypothetical protein MMC25_004865 [Agyrium rufum]|nr:hypothetical protein [Agyrium rufum]